MTNSPIVPGQSFNIRSISLPSRSHPILHKIEGEVQNVNACYDLKGLGELYSCVYEFLNLPSTQQSFSNCNIEKKWLENELEGSIRLLELCGAIKDMLSAVEEHVQDLRLAFRKKGESASEELIREQVFSKKEIRNNIKNCQNLLKRVERMCETFPSTDKTQDLFMVSRVVVEAREATISHLRSVLSSMPGPKSNFRPWSFVSKAMNMRKVGSHREYEHSRVFDNICFKDVEAGLECLFRRLIQARVSLLNLLSL